MAEQEGVFPKLKRFKARTQAAVDSKMQEIANRANEAGYPNLGAGVAAAGSTLAGEALDYVPESPADAAMSAAGPLGRKLKGLGRVVQKAPSADDVRSWIKKGDAVETATQKLKGLGGEESNKAMQQLREAMRAKGLSEEEIRTKLRNINNQVQYGKK
jgi:hypothetical protein